MTWQDLLSEWPLIEADLQDIGIDVGDPAIQHGRSWRWGSARIMGLLSRPPTGYVKVEIDSKHYRMRPIYSSRVQNRFLDESA